MTVVELVNLALLKLGVSQSITSVSDETREAFTAGLVYDHTLRATLRRFPWPFATKYRACREDARHILYLAAGPFWETDPDAFTTVQTWSETATYERYDVVRHDDINYHCILANTNQEPPDATYWSTDEDDAAPSLAGPGAGAGNGDWVYAYRWPDDCLFVRRGVPQSGTGRAFNPSPPPFRIGRDNNGLLIYSNEQEAEFEYTMLDCTDLWSDDLFLGAFTWWLAATMAPSLERAQKTPAECLQMFEIAIKIAEARAMQEGQQEPPGDPDWIRNR